MNRKIFFWGMLLLTFSFVIFIGCDNGNGDNGNDEYTVIFDLDGGKIGENTANVTRTVNSGGTVTDIPTATKDNHTFGGWFSQKNGVGNEFTSSTVVISNRTVYAKWTPDYNENVLPEPVGNNELSGKTFDNGQRKWTFNADNTYSVIIYGDNSEETTLETGNYSWNSNNKTITILAKKIASEIDGELYEKEDITQAYIEYFINNPEYLEYVIALNYTIEQYVSEATDSMFSQKLRYYIIENNIITRLSMIQDTGTTIAGCEYSQKVPQNSGGLHYLLSISFDEALVILIELYGQPRDGWSIQDDSTLSQSTDDWVILEETPWGDIRLHKNESNVTTTKGWN